MFRQLLAIELGHAGALLTLAGKFLFRLAVTLSPHAAVTLRRSQLHALPTPRRTEPPRP